MKKNFSSFLKLVAFTILLSTGSVFAQYPAIPYHPNTLEPTLYVAPTEAFIYNDWITNVNFAGIDNTTANPQWRNNYSATTHASVQRGQTYTLSVTVNSASADFSYQDITAYIDWDRDGDCGGKLAEHGGTGQEPAESYTLGGGAGHANPLTVNITIPNDAALGTTWLRVILKADGYPATDSYLGYFGYGEIEEYAIDVTAGNSAPTVTTQAVSSIAATTATGNGNITSLGTPNPTAYGVCWNTTGTPTTSDSKVDKGAASATGAFAASMTSLTANTTYYVRAYATNTAGTSYGSDVNFTTSATVPGAPTSVSATAGNAQASVSFTAPASNGGSAITGYTVTSSPGGLTGTGATSPISVTGLTNGTAYTFTVTATNSVGTGSASTASSAVTPALPLTVTTQAVSSITSTTAIGNGNVTSLGVPNPTAHGVCWNTVGTPTVSDSKIDIGGKSSTGAFTASMTSLSENTKYYVRAYATNTAGTSYGTEVNFTTQTVPTITWDNPSDIVYGTLLSATQLKATASVPGTFTYTPALGTLLNAGTVQNLKVDFTPTDATNYSTTTKTVTIDVAKATPVITWSNPTGITYNTLLSATQLNATADAAGSIVYSPALGTKLNAGVAQNLQANFTPTDAANYNTATKTVTIDVAKATPVITWSNPADINNETALSSIQLNAIADIAGIFTYTPAIGVKLNVGNAQALKADFEPTDAVNYESATKTVYINVLQATGKSEVVTNKFLLFPNPVINFFSVSGIEGRAKISLSDLNGRVILTKEISNNEMISLENLSRGAYIITLENSNGVSSTTILKK